MKSPRKSIGIIVTETKRRQIPEIQNFPSWFHVLKLTGFSYWAALRSAQVHDKGKYYDIAEIIVSEDYIWRISALGRKVITQFDFHLLLKIILY